MMLAVASIKHGFQITIEEWWYELHWVFLHHILAGAVVTHWQSLRKGRYRHCTV